MIRLYICPKCGWVRTVSRRAQVECFRCPVEKMEPVKLDYETYTSMDVQEREAYVESWMYIHNMR